VFAMCGFLDRSCGMKYFHNTIISFPLRRFLSLLFLFSFLSLCYSQYLSITLSVNRSESPIPFDYIYEIPATIDSSSTKTKAQKLTIDYRDIYGKLDPFCQITKGLPTNCKILLLRQLLKKLSSDMKYPSPWLIPDVAKYSFTSDLIQAICQSNEYLSRFENENQCAEQVESDVRAKKAWMSLYEVLPLRDSMVKNDLIVLKDWTDAIEGHTFVYYEKIKALSKIADDPRVTTICEIGFNFGHSVSSLDPIVF
jgi:hypothetical protein